MPKTKNITNSIIRILEFIRGKKKYELKILGLQVFLITTTYSFHYNVFFLYIPLFRIENEKNRFAFNLLLFVWLFKFITKWKLVILENGYRITLTGKKVFENVVIEPYKFPVTNFKDS